MTATMVSSYYAEIGANLRQSDLRSVKAYFLSIERTINNFKRRMEQQATVQFKVRVDRTSMATALQTSANRIAKSVQFPITRFKVNEQGLVRALNNSLMTTKSQIKVGALLSAGSLVSMRTQIRQSLEGVVISPRINPRVVGGRGATYPRGEQESPSNRPTSLYRRDKNPYYNPMLVGGSLGSVMRFGAFAFPMIGGALGLNALNTFAATNVAQQTALRMSADMSTSGVTAEEHNAFLANLAQRTGKTSMGMTPIYTQFLAASTGTELEPQLQETFGGIMQYASVMGLGEESIKRAMTGFNKLLRAIY